MAVHGWEICITMTAMFPKQKLLRLLIHSRAWLIQCNSPIPGDSQETPTMNPNHRILIDAVTCTAHCFGSLMV